MINRKERRERKEGRGFSSEGIPEFRHFSALHGIGWREAGGVRNANQLCDLIRQTAFDIHVYHSNGHLEKVYENALVHRLRKAGLDAKQQHPISVFDEDGTPIGDYFVDVLVENQIVVELKTARTLASEHEGQILGYLKSSRCEHGLLINFGSFKFEIRKFALSERRPV